MGTHRPELALKPWHSRLRWLLPPMCDSYLTKNQAVVDNNYQCRKKIAKQYLKIKYNKGLAKESCLAYLQFCSGVLQSFKGLLTAAEHSEEKSRGNQTEQAQVRPPAEGGAVVQVTLGTKSLFYYKMFAICTLCP